MKIGAIDPGDVRSAWVIYEFEAARARSVRVKPGRVVAFGLTPNEELLASLPELFASVDQVAIEQIRSYGMAVGREIFETCEWTGRFIQVLDTDVAKVPRLDVKQELLGRARGTDTEIRHALWAYFGGGRREAVGTKAAPGPMFGLSGNDLIAALGVAVAYASRLARREPFDLWRATRMPERDQDSLRSGVACSG